MSRFLNNSCINHLWFQEAILYLNNLNDKLTVASFSIYSSGAPRDANPISWENCAKLGSANRGTWPRSSWQMSGSGVYKGLLGCLIYWVLWKTLNASPAKKSLDERSPATGRRVNPVQSVWIEGFLSIWYNHMQMLML